MCAVQAAKREKDHFINFPNIEIFEEFFPEDCIALSFDAEHTFALEVSL